jgi:hypothetical protein
MAAHDHREFVPGCFRCDLSRDESPDFGALAARLYDEDGEPLSEPFVLDGPGFFAKILRTGTARSIIGDDGRPIVDRMTLELMAGETFGIRA